jgi:23S rRNA pseudouridine2605 synthase
MDERPAGHKGGERLAKEGLAKERLAKERLAKERLAKAIARAGLASRREAEGWIEAGRVAVNGEVTRSPACNVDVRDRITVDGEPLPARERTRLFLYHKPRGLMTTHADPQGRPTIFAKLPKELPRLISVGRLDFNTEGLLLLTNDGALARVLELPATGWLRRYRVRAHGAVTQQELDSLRAGIAVSGIEYGPIDAQLDRVQGSNLWLTFAIREGKNREVRNVLGELGLAVTRLIRISFGPFQLGELAEGAVEEVRTRVLREQLGAKLVAAAGADFSMPISQSRASPQRDAAAERKETKAPSHSWRAPHEEAQKPLRRKFRGSRSDRGEPRDKSHAEAHAETLTDRKGRRFSVERHGEPKREQRAEPPKRSEKFKRGGKRRRASADRASGPRPSRPRN